MKSKIWLIIKREYFTRVRNRTFILSTILLPLFILLFVFGTAYLTSKSQGEKQKIAVNDQSGLFKSSFRDKANIEYDFTTEVNENNFAQKGYTAFLFIPENHSSSGDSIKLVSAKQINIATQDDVKDGIDEAIRNKVFLENHIDKKLLDSINKVKPEQLYRFSAVVNKGNKTEHSNPLLSYGIGFGSGFLIYFVLIIYGASVMRGVMEEKTNRIAEVIISSVRPFQLMAGKIIGIAAVGLTQLFMWFILVIILLAAGTFFLSHGLAANTDSLQAALASQQGSSLPSEFLSAKSTFLSANWLLIIPCFIFYFLAGYLFYASLFAAAGSIVNEDPQDAQALTIPITMPIILSFVLMTAVISNPDSTLAVWGSIIPFSSPIVMMARIPSGNVLPWELILSIVLLVGGFTFTTYIAAKIYRTGILLYGKKVTLKEIGKWLFRKS